MQGPTLLLCAVLATFFIPGRMEPASPCVDREGCDPSATVVGDGGSTSEKLLGFAGSARKVHISNVGKLYRRTTEGIWGAIKNDTESMLQDGGYFKEGHTGKAIVRFSRRAGHLVCSVVGHAWIGLGVGLEMGGDMLVSFLNGLRKSVTLAGYWVAVITHVIAAVLSPCRPFGPLDCGGVQASVVDKAMRVQSTSLKHAMRVIRLMGSKLTFLTHNVRVHIISRFLLPQSSLKRVREIYSLANGRKVSFLKGILQFVTRDVVLEAVGPLPSGLCSETHKHLPGYDLNVHECSRVWIGHDGLQDIYSKAIEKLQSFTLLLDEDTVLYDQVKNCVHVGGTQIGLAEQGEQLQGAFDHVFCFNSGDKITRMRLNWNDTPQAGVRTDSG